MEKRFLVSEKPAQQEPVAFVSGYYGGKCVILPIDPARIFNSNTALYTSPPAQRRPLTGDEIRQISDKCDDGQESAEFILAFARAIEAKLKKENT
jgi:hypothetical protein